MLKTQKEIGVLLVPIPFAELLKQVQDHFPNARTARMVNVLAVGASLGLVGLPPEPLRRALQNVFRAKPRIAEMNIWGADLARQRIGDEYYSIFPIA